MIQAKAATGNRPDNQKQEPPKQNTNIPTRNSLLRLLIFIASANGPIRHSLEVAVVPVFILQVPGTLASVRIAGRPFPPEACPSSVSFQPHPLRDRSRTWARRQGRSVGGAGSEAKPWRVNIGASEGHSGVAPCRLPGAGAGMR